MSQYQLQCTISIMIKRQQTCQMYFRKRQIFTLTIHDRLRLESSTLKALDQKYKTILSLGSEQSRGIRCYITDLSKKIFKTILRKLLFDILEKEDDYIHIPMIIKKQIHLIKVLMPAFLLLCYYLRLLMHCTSVNPVLIRSLKFCVLSWLLVLFTFSCNLQGFLIV